MWEKRVPLMLNIFKDIPIFSVDFIQFKCREMTLLYTVIYKTSALTLHIYLHIYEADILTSNTYLHLKQFFWIFKWCCDFLHTNIIKTHCLSVFCLCVRHWCIKRLSDAIPCLFMIIFPQAIEAPLHWWCTGIYVMHSSFVVFSAKEILKKKKKKKKQLPSSLLVLHLYLNTPTPLSSSNYIRIASPF